MDAEIIARYGLVMHPGCWVPPSTALMDLKTLTREREFVLVRRTQENNHLIALRDAHHAAAVVLTLAQQRLDLLDQQLVALDAALHELVDADVTLAQPLKLLLSVPGFAFTSAATVLAETAGFSRLETAEEISAAAGMAPSSQQSGLKNGKGSISKTGNARLRRIAYLSALGASKSHNRLNDHRLKPEGLKVQGSGLKVRLQTPYTPNSRCQPYSPFQVQNQTQHHAES